MRMVGRDDGGIGMHWCVSSCVRALCGVCRSIEDRSTVENSDTGEAVAIRASLSGYQFFGLVLCAAAEHGVGSPYGRHAHASPSIFFSPIHVYIPRLLQWSRSSEKEADPIPMIPMPNRPKKYGTHAN